MTGIALDKRKFFDLVGYTPHEGQREIQYDTTRFRVLANGRRWGKTHLGAHEIEPTMFTVDPITGGPQIGWIVGPQYTDTEKEFRIVYDTMRKLGVDRDAIRFVNNSAQGAFHIKLSWGSEIIGKSAKHPETLVGEGLNWALLVEAGRHRRKTWAEYLRPALSDKRGWAMLTGVPEGRSDQSLLYHLWQRGQGNRNLQWKSWRRPSWTNNIVFPGGRNDPEILSAEEDLTEDEFRRQYGAEFVERVGAVMQEWDDEVHLRDLDVNPDWPIYLAVDYGFTNPFVVLFIQVDEWDNVYVIREQRWTLVDTEDVCKDLLADPHSAALVRRATAIYPDPAEPDDTLTMTRKLRIPARKNTGGPLKTRLSLIRQFLKVQNIGKLDEKPRLLVDRSCVELAWEMREGYRWPEHRSDVRSDSEHPQDKDNHGTEALGRFMRGYFAGTAGEKRKSRSREAVMNR